MSIKKFLAKYKVHIFILFIAILIWVHVKTEMKYDVVIQVKVIPTNQNSEFVISNDYTSKVPVLFHGSGKNLIAAKNSDVEILADLKQSRKRHVVTRLDFQDLRYSPSILELEPIEFVKKDTIHFYLSPLIHKKVDVEPQIDIIPASDFIQVNSVQISPSKVTISGPKDKIQKIKKIKTESVRLSKKKTDVIGQVPLINPYPEKATIDKQIVEYSAQIQPLKEKTLTDIPIQVINVPSNRKVSVVPPTLSLKIKGGAEIIKKIKEKDILAYIDLRRYRKSEDSSVPATIKVPDNVSFSDVNPKKFKLKIE